MKTEEDETEKSAVFPLSLLNGWIFNLTVPGSQCTKTVYDQLNESKRNTNPTVQSATSQQQISRILVCIACAFSIGFYVHLFTKYKYITQLESEHNRHTNWTTDACAKGIVPAVIEFSRLDTRLTGTDTPIRAYMHRIECIWHFGVCLSRFYLYHKQLIVKIVRNCYGFCYGLLPRISTGDNNGINWKSAPTRSECHFHAQKVSWIVPPTEYQVQPIR